MADKVKLELRPYTALAILCFCKEYINDDNKNDPTFASIHESVNEYEQEINKKVSIQQLEDAKLENQVNQITGRCPG